MQVNYKTAGQVGGNFAPLFDEAAGDALAQFTGVFAGIVQREPLAGSQSQARFPRGNTTGKIQFKWTSTYASADAAQTGIATVDSLKLTAVHLQIIEGAITQYLPNAISDKYEFDRQGSSVTHTLTFESDDLTINAP